MRPLSPEFHLRRLAEKSLAVGADNPPELRSLAQAIEFFPYRSAIAAPPGGGKGAEDLPPITGAVALVPGVPFTGADFAQAVQEAAAALRLGGTFLILATERTQRDEVKARIMAALDAMTGLAGTGGRA